MPIVKQVFMPAGFLRAEERASADYLAGKIYGVVHCYIGGGRGRRLQHP